MARPTKKGSFYNCIVRMVNTNQSFGIKLSPYYNTINLLISRCTLTFAVPTWIFFLIADKSNYNTLKQPWIFPFQSWYDNAWQSCFTFCLTTLIANSECADHRVNMSYLPDECIDSGSSFPPSLNQNKYYKD